MQLQILKKNCNIIISVFFIICVCSCAGNKKNSIHKQELMFCNVYEPVSIYDENVKTPAQIVCGENEESVYNNNLEILDETLPYNEKIEEDTDINFKDSFEISYNEYSKKMGINFSGTENKDLLMAIDEWIGAPYKWGGCSQYGVDCSCLVKNIYEDVFDIQLNRTSLLMFQKNLISVAKHDLKTGDIIAFDMNNTGSISHVGIYLKDNKFVHASLSKGVRINSLDENYYKKRFVKGGRVKLTTNIQLAELFIKDLIIINE